MIIDSLENFRQYFKDDVFNNIYQEICKIDVTHNLGEFTLKDNEIFYKVLEYNTKQEKWITESHRKYVDIQIILSGEEVIKIYDYKSSKTEVEYDSNTDCIFYSVINSTNKSEITLRKGDFAVFFPQDIHQTQIAVNNKPELIKKLVFKVHEKFFA